MINLKSLSAQFHALLWRVDDWRYVGAVGRDLRLDYLRGFAVFAMIVDHLGSSSWFAPLTGGNHFIVSAAEGFVFISGLLVGIVYGDVMRRSGWWAAARKALARAWTLYTLTVPLTLGFVWLIYTLNLPFASWYTLDETWQVVIKVITLRQTFVFADIPLLYTQLLLIAPLCLALLRLGRTALLLVLSALLWGAYQLAPGVLDGFPWTIEGNWIFHLPAWQLLFVVALTLGYHRAAAMRWFTAKPRMKHYIALGVAFAALIYLSGRVNLDDPALKSLFEKGNLGLGRLAASAVVFPFFYLTLTLFWVPLHGAFGWLLNPLGENSLYSYTLHVFWLVIFYTVVPTISGDANSNIAVNTVLQACAVLLTRQAIQRRVLFRILPR